MARVLLLLLTIPTHREKEEREKTAKTSFDLVTTLRVSLKETRVLRVSTVCLRIAATNQSALWLPVFVTEGD